MFSASIVKLPGFFSYLWTLSAELQTSQKATTEVPDKARNIANAELLLDRLSFFTVSQQITRLILPFCRQIVSKQ
jgi:hypothetical protein